MMCTKEKCALPNNIVAVLDDAILRRLFADFEKMKMLYKEYDGVSEQMLPATDALSHCGREHF